MSTKKVVKKSSKKVSTKKAAEKVVNDTKKEVSVNSGRIGENECRIRGNLGHNPVLRHTANGTAVTNLRVAVNDINGNTEWLEAIVFGKLAENCVKYLFSGRHVQVKGKLTTSTSTGADGTKYIQTKILAETVDFLDSKKKVEVEESSEERVSI